MRTLLYIIAFLMIGISIYGFVSNSGTDRSDEFMTINNEEETKAPGFIKEKKSGDVAGTVNRN